MSEHLPTTPPPQKTNIVWRAIKAIAPSAGWDTIKVLCIAIGTWAMYTIYHIIGWLAGVPRHIITDVVVLICLVCVGFVLFVYAKRRDKKQTLVRGRRVMPIVIGAVVGVLVGGVLGALIGWRIYGRTVSNVPLEVARAFEVARARYADRLGDPLSDVYPIEWVYHAQHEHATVILPYKGLVYALKNDDGDGNRVLKELDDYGVTDSNNYWLKDDEIIKLFVGKFGAERGTPPEGLSPPYGSVALGWFTEPDKWEGIGWRMNHCWHEKENVYVQRFQNGLIIGSLRQKPIIDDAQAGRIYVLLTKEHKWEYVEGEQGVFPPCQKPRTS